MNMIDMPFSQLWKLSLGRKLLSFVSNWVRIALQMVRLTSEIIKARQWQWEKLQAVPWSCSKDWADSFGIGNNNKQFHESAPTFGQVSCDCLLFFPLPNGPLQNSLIRLPSFKRYSSSLGLGARESWTCSCQLLPHLTLTLNSTTTLILRKHLCM